MIFIEAIILVLACVHSVKLQKASQLDNNNPSFYNIGGVLSSNDSATHFHDTIAVSFFFSIQTIFSNKKDKICSFISFSIIQHLNFDQTYVPRGVTYYAKDIRIDKNPIRTALNVCKQLITKRVSVKQH